jgi:hypothetical protein
MTETAAVFTLENVANLISIITPLILLVWFYYTLKQSLSKNLYNELRGIFAGFIRPSFHGKDGDMVHAGMILNIRDVDHKGYFKGQFDMRESVSSVKDSVVSVRVVSDGLYSFLGDIKFELFRDIKRHPFNVKENRIYSGKLYIIDRLDFNLERFDMKDYVRAEYSIRYLREMEVLELTLDKVHRKGSQNFPAKTILYKSAGFSFEPYESVKKVVFSSTRVDK